MHFLDLLAMGAPEDYIYLILTGYPLEINQEANIFQETRNFYGIVNIFTFKF